MVFSSSISAPTTGAENVLGILQGFQSAGRFTRVTAWRSEGLPGGLRVIADMPLSSFYEKYEWDISLDPSGRIVNLVQRGIAQTTPLPPSAIHLTDEIANALTAAREARNPVILAYIDPTGRPNQSPRGTTQVLSKTQLAFWNHDPESSFIRALRANPAVSIHYWGGIGTTFGGALSFAGIATISDDDSVRHKIYYGSPESERRSDPNRAGRAVVVNLERVTGFLAGTRYNMDAGISEPARL